MKKHSDFWPEWRMDTCVILGSTVLYYTGNIQYCTVLADEEEEKSIKKRNAHVFTRRLVRNDPPLSASFLHPTFSQPRVVEERFRGASVADLLNRGA